MKTYENFITDLYYKTKFPKEVNELADTITNLLKELLQVKIVKKYDLDFRHAPAIRIKVKDRDMDENLLSIKLHSKIVYLSTKVEETKIEKFIEFSLMQFLPNSYVYAKRGLDKTLLNNIYDFLESIFKKHSEVSASKSKLEYVFDVPEEKLNDVVEEFQNAKDKFEFFVNTKNYNL